MPTDREHIFQALHDAIGWQEGLADAWSHISGSPEHQEAKDQIKAYKRILKKRYGTSLCAMDKMLEGATKVSAFEYRSKTESKE